MKAPLSLGALTVCVEWRDRVFDLPVKSLPSTVIFSFSGLGLSNSTTLVYFL